MADAGDAAAADEDATAGRLLPAAEAAAVCMAGRAAGAGAAFGFSLIGSMRWNVCGSLTSCCAHGKTRRTGDFGVRGAFGACACAELVAKWGVWRGARTWRRTSAVLLLSCSRRPAKISRCVDGAGCSGCCCCSASLICLTVPLRGT